MARKPKRKPYPGRTITCPRCKLEKKHNARGLCRACYVHFQRNGILHRAGPSQQRHPSYTPYELALMKALRDEGKTCREVAAHFPTRTFWAVRLVCVKNGFVRFGVDAELARLERLIEERRATLPNDKRKKE